VERLTERELRKTGCFERPFPNSELRDAFMLACQAAPREAALAFIGSYPQDGESVPLHAVAERRRDERDRAAVIVAASWLREPVASAEARELGALWVREWEDDTETRRRKYLATRTSVDRILALERRMNAAGESTASGVSENIPALRELHASLVSQLSPEGRLWLEDARLKRTDAGIQ